MTQRIRRNISGQRLDALTQAIHINCFDARRIKLLFILNEAEPNPLSQSQRPPLPDSSEQTQGSPNSSPRSVLCPNACMYLFILGCTFSIYLLYGCVVLLLQMCWTRLLLFRSKKKVFTTGLGERVQNWKNGLPEKVQHMKIGGRFGWSRGGDDTHRQYSEVYTYADPHTHTLKIMVLVMAHSEWVSQWWNPTGTQFRTT